MKIRDKFVKGKHTVSLEFFPPKNIGDIEKLYDDIGKLSQIKPDFVSITYGAGGSTRDKTVEIASHIKNDMNIEVMSHLTCVNSTIKDIDSVLEELKKRNIDNILALRGDPPQGQENFTKTIGGFGYASELTNHISKNHDFSIGVAGYPEGHIESKSIEEDMNHLSNKVSNGADFIITQLFFNNDYFYRFRDLCVKKHINVPLIPGILPVLNFSSVKRITSLCGTKIPEKLFTKLEKHQNDKEAIEKIGIEYAIEQINDLLDNDLDGLHLYSLNRSKEINEIYDAVKGKIKRNNQ